MPPAKAAAYNLQQIFEHGNYQSRCRNAAAHLRFR